VHEWLKPYLEQDLDPANLVIWLHNAALFWTEFDRPFGKVNKVDNYHGKLHKLSQTKSAQDYLRKFQTLLAPLRYDTVVLRHMFYDGLKENIKDAMLAQNFNPHTSTFTELSNRALQIDAHLEAYKPVHSSTTSYVTSVKNTSNIAPSAFTPSLRASQDRLNKGDPDFMIGADGNAERGYCQHWEKCTRIGNSNSTMEWVQ
jgi:hypothetical protein